MARKKRGKHVAAKQAQLSQRKKRGRGPSGIPTASAAQRRRQPVTAAPASGAATAGSEATPVLATASAAASASPQTAGALTARQPLVYSYAGMELRRILLLSGVMIAAIVVLSIFLN